MGRVAGKYGAVALVPTPRAAPSAKRCAPIRDTIEQDWPRSTGRNPKDIIVRLLAVARIFRVPVGKQHHHDLQSSKLVRGPKRIIGPRPGAVRQEHQILFTTELKPSFRERAV